MIRLWLSRSAPVPVREQIASQIILGILSGRLAPGEPLPSVRELARRLGLHANTISSAYRDLNTRGWVAHHRGGRVVVREINTGSVPEGPDTFARSCMREALQRGYSFADMQTAFARLQESETLEYLVVDPDAELAHILAAEISEALGREVRHAGLDSLAGQIPASVTLLANAAYAAPIVEKLEPVRFRAIPIRSTQDVIAGIQRPQTPVLIGVVSRSPRVLQWASTLLSALGFPPDAVVLRNPTEPGWRDGLSVCHIVGADVVAASEIKDRPPFVFRIVTTEFVNELSPPVTAKKLSHS